MQRMLVRHAVVWVLGAAMLRLAIVPAEACPAVAPDTVHQAAVSGGEWLVDNMDASGRFLYGYDRESGEESSDYNIVRHGGATLSLYQLAAAGDEQFLAPADLALEFLLDHAREHDGSTAIVYGGGSAKVGAAGIAVLALAQRRAITADTSYDPRMRSLGRFIVAQQEPDGSILVFWSTSTKKPVPDQYGAFATGEAAWALVELDNAFPGEGWWETAELTLHYMADGSRAKKEGRRTRIPDHWAAYALAAAGPDRLDDALVDYAQRLAGYFSAYLRFEAQRTGTPLSFAFRGYPGLPSGIATGAEGMAALHRLAVDDPRLRSLRPDMWERLYCNAGLMVDRQVGLTEAAEDAVPGRVEGAWFYRSYTQVDYQQHVLSGLLGAERAMLEERG